MSATATMKLSEAIRIGAAKRPQAFGEYFDEHFDETAQDYELCSCALGACYEGMFGEPADDQSVSTGLKERLGARVYFGLHCCPLDDSRGTLAGTIAHLNDDHEWTREQIADWLESIGL